MLATSNSSVLSVSVQQIKDAISDFRNSSVEQEALNIINRIISLFNSEPLAEFLTSALPTIDFKVWCDKSEINAESMGGVIEWPDDIEERVAIQVELCRIIKTHNNVLMHFTRQYCYPQSLQHSEYFSAFATKVLDPLVRDIERLIALRPVSPILLEAMRNFPLSGDDVLDEKLQEACRKFKDPAPQALQDAVEKLWDSFERLKNSEDRDKKKSVKILLDKATDCQEFRDQLEQEATTLTSIGNKFQIRHFEPPQVKLNESEHLEYLFHRLYSLIRFLLLARNKTKENL
jgi:hypothetical protein